eukprot:1040070-Pelagomonas_calceolata.AAC.4
MEFEQLQDRIPPFPNDQAFQGHVSSAKTAICAAEAAHALCRSPYAQHGHSFEWLVLCAAEVACPLCHAVVAQLGCLFEGG